MMTFSRRIMLDDIKVSNARERALHEFLKRALRLLFRVVSFEGSSEEDVPGRELVHEFGNR